MRTEERTIYKFNELSDTAKEKAREWYREGNLDYNWWDSVYDWFEDICKAIGIELDTKPVKLMNGSTRHDPCIYFSGFWSQGDGACFQGRYRYEAGTKDKIRQACGDAEIHRIADSLAEIQRRNFYKIGCKIYQSGRYCHEHTMRFDFYDDKLPSRQDEDDIEELMRDLARWLYSALEKEYEYLQSDEVVDENILCNGYEFDENGDTI